MSRANGCEKVFSLTNIYTYNKNGTKKTFTGPDNITYGYLYDANNQLTGVQIPNVGFITISEYTWNRPKSMTLPGGSTKTYEYDPLMRTKQITAKDPGQNILMNYQYTYDKMDNITAKTTEYGNYNYGYDDLYRLNTVDNPVQDDEAFTYDVVGNRLTAEGMTGNWSYNTNNELTGYDDVSYIYDDNGNMTQKTVAGVVSKFFYNIEDRLAEVKDGSDNLIASYYYDPFGRRLWKEVSGVRTYFHYADEGLVGEYDSIGNEIKSYAYKPGSTWTTDPLFMKIGSEYYFYQNDHLGTPQKLTAINGAVVWSAKYSSFGEATVDAASTVTNPLRFPGQYYDTETGLHYNWHRYYDSGGGRYIKADPSGLDGGNNLFTYSNNMPLKFIDFRGLACEQITNWERIKVVQKLEEKGELIYSEIRGKWRLLKTYPVLPIASKGEASSLACGCLWEKVGCEKVSTYSIPVLHEAKFECEDSECRVWEETRYEELYVTFIKTEKEDCYFHHRQKTTSGFLSGGTCDCVGRPPID